MKKSFPIDLQKRAVVVFGTTGMLVGLLWTASLAQSMAGVQQPAPRASGSTQPAAPTGTSSLSGVASDTSGKAIRRVTVRLSSAPLVSRSTVTDDQGRFAFESLPAAEYTLTAMKGGYLDSIFGQKKPGSGRPGTPIKLLDGQKLDKLTIPMVKGGVITGVITDDAGEPAFGAQVRAMRYVMKSGERTLTTGGSTETDDRGVYRIPMLPSGDYVVSVQARDDAAAADKAAREQILPAAVIKGGPDGPPLRPSSSADDAPSAGYAPVYFPGTTSAAAAANVAIKAGEEHSGVDIQLELVPLSKVSGVVIAADPNVLNSITIQLVDPQALPGTPPRTTRPNPDGRFSFAGVAPGQYSLVARSGASVFFSVDSSGGQTRTMVFTARLGLPGGNVGGNVGGPGAMRSAGPTLWARAETTVDGRAPETVRLELQPGMTMTGRVLFDGAGQPPSDLTQIRIVLSPATVDGAANGGAAMGQVDADGTFRIPDVVPGTYHLTAIGARSWRPGAAEINGHDALDFPLEVKPGEDIANATLTFTDRTTELSGTLQDPTGRPTADYTVVLFPKDPRYWLPQSRRIQGVRPATDGRFLFQNVPGGDYLLIAVTDLDTGQWFDPALLRELAGAAMSITISDGEHKTQDVRLAR